MFAGSKSCVKNWARAQAGFEITTGVRQGGLLSPLLFKIAIRSCSPKRSHKTGYKNEYSETQKSNIMKILTTEERSVTVESQELENIYRFVYLGSTLYEDGDV